MKAGFQWFVAWRYLMARPRRFSVAIVDVVWVLTLFGVASYLVGVVLIGSDPDGPALIATGPDSESAARLRVIRWVAGALASALFAVGWYFVRARSRRRPFPATLALSAAVVCALAAAFAELSLRGVIVDWPATGNNLMQVTAACAALVELSLLMGLVRYFFTFFTSVSMGGVAIGTMALVIVLSVMSGFETDLRDKILGSNAHLRVTKNSDTFAEYRDVIQKIENIPSVVAATPFLTSEVVIGASSSYANVVIKGIDPMTVANVTDLQDNLEDDDETLLRLYPLDEDGTIRGPDAEPYPAPEPDPLRADGPTRDVVDPAPPDLDVPDGEPVDLSGGSVFHDAFLIDDADLQRAAREQELEAQRNEATGGWPDSLSGRAYAGPRRHSSSSPRVNQLDGVLVGRELVKNLHLYAGQEVSLVSPLGQMTPAGPAPRSKPYRIAGTFYTGMYEYDTKFIYVEFGSLQRFLSLDDEVSGIEIRVVDRDDTAGIKVAVAKALGPDFDVKDWKEINRNLFSALELEKIAMFLVLAIIILVASFSIIGNLIMVVVEKAREIGLLKTLGASDEGIMKIFVVQGFCIGLVGTAIGVSNGLIACWIGKTWGLPLDPDVYYIDRLPIAVEWSSVAAVAAAGLLISVLATVYPAYLAARVKPVEGLRYE